MALSARAGRRKRRRRRRKKKKKGDVRLVMAEVGVRLGGMVGWWEEERGEGERKEKDM